ncbi:MAG TPA: TIGR01212 family radical SAM protein [Lachnospiraceae bacterium]|nr:TIGR01212 family radical SAM protein [Lachnospiraceae bacterium]
MTGRSLWNGRPYYSLDAYCRDTFGEKVYRLPLDGGMTCPNRDGTLGTGGCIFCSAGGSGEFAGSRRISITEQLKEQIAQIRAKRPIRKFIAYFQAYTNTYAPVDTLRKLFTEAVRCPDVVALSVATRPDCLPDETVRLLEELNCIKPVWVELGLQTIHEETARYIRRGYPLSCFTDAVKRLHESSITQIITHTILGLPGESDHHMYETMEFLNMQPVTGVKLQLLHVLSGTDLARDYAEGRFDTLTRTHYIQLVIRCLEILSPDLVIHRLTGDGPKQLLIAPLWSGAKRSVLNDLHHQMKLLDTWQGKKYKKDGKP